MGIDAVANNQAVKDVVLAPACGEVDRVFAVDIRDMGVGAIFDEDVDGMDMTMHDGEEEWGVPPVVLGIGVEIVAIDEMAGSIVAITADGVVNGVLSFAVDVVDVGAVLGEKIEDEMIAVFGGEEKRCDAQAVLSVNRNGIMSEEVVDGFVFSVFYGEKEGVMEVAVDVVDIGAVAGEEVEGRDVAFSGGEEEGGSSRRVGDIRVGAFLEVLFDERPASGFACGKQFAIDGFHGEGGAEVRL